MDFLDPKKKRAHQKRLFIGYGLIAIALGIATTILVFAANGYEVNRKTGAITQNGLLFVDGHPDSAQILINGVDKGQTSSRYVLEEGNYTLKLQRDGYRPWTHNFTLEGGSVERFAYPFLFPATLTSKDIQLYASAPDVVSTSPDRHWIVSHAPDSLTGFQVTDISSKDALTTNVKVPATVLPVHPNSSLEPVEWSTDNRHLLLKYVYEGGQDFIMFDRDTPADSLNLTTVFGKSFSQVTLRDKKADQLYVYDATGGILQSAQIKDKTLTPLATKVLAFWPYQDNTILYATDNDAAPGHVYIRVLQDAKTYTVRDLPVGQKYLLNMAEFNGHLYVTVGDDTDGKVYVYKDLFDVLRKQNSTLPLPSILLKVNGTPQYVSFSANARFIAVQGGSKFAVYDAENNRQFRYDTQLALDGIDQKATWMDGHRLMVTSQGKLNVFDFDGTNKQTLNAVTGIFEPMFDRDYTFLFTVSPSTTVKDRTAIVRTVLKITN